ncbi:MAG: amino acid--tRNA ligase-related protein [Caldilineaceae bacterium]
MRDGTGIRQAVVFKGNVTDDVFEEVRNLTQERSVIVTGTVKADERAPGVPGGYEVDVNDVTVLQVAEAYPISPKEHGVEFLMKNRHLWLRSSRQWAAMRVRAVIIQAIREWLDGNGYINIDTPILTPAAAEGTTSSSRSTITGSSRTWPRPASCTTRPTLAFGKVYCFGPTFRAEKSKTRRHLQEFWMVEPEVAFCDLDQLMEIEEQFVSHIVQRYRATAALNWLFWNATPPTWRK